MRRTHSDYIFIRRHNDHSILNYTICEVKLITELLILNSYITHSAIGIKLSVR